MLKSGEFTQVNPPLPETGEGDFYVEEISMPNIGKFSLMKQAVVKEWLMDPQVRQTPELLAEAWTGALLNRKLYDLGYRNRSEPQPDNKLKRLMYQPPLNDSWMKAYHSRIIRDTLVDSGHWDKILENVSNHKATLHEVMLVTWQASAHDRLSCIKPLPFGTQDSTESKRTLNDYASVAKLPAQQALYSYWLIQERVKWRTEQQKKANAGEEYATRFFRPDISVTSPSLPLKVLADQIRTRGFIDSLNIERPNYLLWALFDDYERYCSVAVTTTSGTNRDGAKHKADTTIKSELSLRNQLKSYIDDVSAYQRGNTAIASRNGSPWRFLQKDGETMYRRYLDRRYKLVPASNEVFCEAMGYAPGALHDDLHRTLVELQQDDNLSEDKNFETRERLGAIWATVSLRQDEEPFSELAAKYSPYIKDSLETYMLDGLTLLKQERAPIWMKQLAYVACFTKNDHLHPFTDSFGSVKDDKRETFDSLTVKHAKRDQDGLLIKNYTKEHNLVLLAQDIVDSITYKRARTQAEVQLINAVKSINKNFIDRTLRNLPPKLQARAVEILTTRPMAASFHEKDESLYYVD